MMGALQEKPAIAAVQPVRSRGLSFRPMLAGDVVQLDLQPSQHVTLGVHSRHVSYDDGLELVEYGTDCWTAVRSDGKIIACAGLRYLWPPSDRTNGHALAWALLGTGLGTDHLAITRFLRDVIAASPLTRIEAVVRAGVKAERTFVRLLGLSLEASLTAWGPDGEDHELYARIRRD